MDLEPVLTPLDSKSGASIYRKEGDYIYPLPEFVTKEGFDKPSYPRSPRAPLSPAAMGDEIADFSI